MVDRTDDTRPTPDPTVLTTEQLLREIDRLTALMRSEVACLREIIEEKLHAVTLQFELIERQRVEQKKDTADAVSAALAAAEKAVREQTAAAERSQSKSENATHEQIEQLKVSSQSGLDSINASLSEVKERVGRIENLKQGGNEKVLAIYAAVGFALTLLLLVGAMAAYVGTR